MANGEDREAAYVLREGLGYAAQVKWREAAGIAIDALACLAARTQSERAARLFGASEQINPYLVTVYYKPLRSARDAAIAYIRATLGEERWSALLDEGRALPFASAVALAME